MRVYKTLMCTLVVLHLHSVKPQVAVPMKLRIEHATSGLEWEDFIEQIMMSLGVTPAGFETEEPEPGDPTLSPDFLNPNTSLMTSLKNGSLGASLHDLAQVEDLPPLPKTTPLPKTKPPTTAAPTTTSQSTQAPAGKALSANSSVKGVPAKQVLKNINARVPVFHGILTLHYESYIQPAPSGNVTKNDTPPASPVLGGSNTGPVRSLGEPAPAPNPPKAPGTTQVITTVKSIVSTMVHGPGGTSGGNNTLDSMPSLVSSGKLNVAANPQARVELAVDATKNTSVVEASLGGGSNSPFTPRNLSDKVYTQGHSVLKTTEDTLTTVAATNSHSSVVGPTIPVPVDSSPQSNNQTTTTNSQENANQTAGELKTSLESGIVNGGSTTASISVTETKKQGAIVTNSTNTNTSPHNVPVTTTPAPIPPTTKLVPSVITSDHSTKTNSPNNLTTTDAGSKPLISIIVAPIRNSSLEEIRRNFNDRTAQLSASLLVHQNVSSPQTQNVSDHFEVNPLHVSNSQQSELVNNQSPNNQSLGSTTLVSFNLVTATVSALSSDGENNFLEINSNVSVSAELTPENRNVGNMTETNDIVSQGTGGFVNVVPPLHLPNKDAQNAVDVLTNKTAPPEGAALNDIAVDLSASPLSSETLLWPQLQNSSVSVIGNSLQSNTTTHDTVSKQNPSVELQPAADLAPATANPVVTQPATLGGRISNTTDSVLDVNVAQTAPGDVTSGTNSLSSSSPTHPTVEHSTALPNSTSTQSGISRIPSTANSADVASENSQSSNDTLSSVSNSLGPISVVSKPTNANLSRESSSVKDTLNSSSNWAGMDSTTDAPTTELLNNTASQESLRANGNPRSSNGSQGSSLTAQISSTDALSDTTWIESPSDKGSNVSSTVDKLDSYNATGSNSFVSVSADFSSVDVNGNNTNLTETRTSNELMTGALNTTPGTMSTNNSQVDKLHLVTGKMSTTIKPVDAIGNLSSVLFSERNGSDLSSSEITPSTPSIPKYKGSSNLTISHPHPNQPRPGTEYGNNTRPGETSNLIPSPSGDVVLELGQPELVRPSAPNRSLSQPVANGNLSSVGSFQDSPTGSEPTTAPLAASALRQAQSSVMSDIQIPGHNWPGGSASTQAVSRTVMMALIVASLMFIFNC